MCTIWDDYVKNSQQLVRAMSILSTRPLIAMQKHQKQRQNVWVQLNFVSLGQGRIGINTTRKANCGEAEIGERYVKE